MFMKNGITEKIEFYNHPSYFQDHYKNSIGVDTIGDLNRQNKSRAFTLTKLNGWR